MEYIQTSLFKKGTVLSCPHHRYRGGVHKHIHPWLTSALDVNMWPNSRPCRFTSKGKQTCTHWVEGWVGPTAGLDACGEEKNLLPQQAFDPLIIQPLA